MSNLIFPRRKTLSKYKTFNKLLCCVICLLLQGCIEDKPSSSDLKAEVIAGSNKDGNYFTVSDVDIEAQENKGDSVDPRWKSRFTVTYKTNIPLYKMTGSDSVATFVTESHPEGFTFTVPYTATSTLNSRGEWQSTLYRGESDEVNNLGDPIERWSGMVVREGHETDQAKYDMKLAENKEKQLTRNNLISKSRATLQDNELTKKTIQGYWKDRCNNRGGWAGSMSLNEDGSASWNMQGGPMNEGEYTVQNGIITFTWYKNFRKTKPVQWRINILTKDHLEIEQRGMVCVAKRTDDERI